MKKLFILTAILSLGAFPARADILLGTMGPMTGPYAAIGEQAAHGIAQAVAAVNAQGGIYGEKIILKPQDDACDPKQAVTVANQFASSGVKFVIDYSCSSAAIPAAKIFNEENILMLATFATNPALTDAGFKNVFRICGRDDKQGVVQARYVLDHFRNWKIAIMHDNSAGGRGQAEVFKKTLNDAGVQEIIFDAYTPGERDYSALVARLKQNGIQFLDIGGYHTEAGLIARQIKQQGADIQIMGGDALATQEFWSIAGDAGNGVLMTFEPDMRRLPDAKPAIDALHKAGFEPEGYTLYGYAAVQVLTEALKKTGANPMTAAPMIRSASTQTVIGKIGFDDKGDALNADYVVYRWKNGSYSEISP